jgi:hypothetical protein
MGGGSARWAWPGPGTDKPHTEFSQLTVTLQNALTPCLLVSRAQVRVKTWLLGLQSPLPCLSPVLALPILSRDAGCAPPSNGVDNDASIHGHYLHYMVLTWQMATAQCEAADVLAWPWQHGSMAAW